METRTVLKSWRRLPYVSASVSRVGKDGSNSTGNGKSWIATRWRQQMTGGATGLGQIYELVNQLRREAGASLSWSAPWQRGLYFLTVLNSVSGRVSEQVRSR